MDIPGPWATSQRIVKVLLHIEMREQPGVLKHIADMTLPDWRGEARILPCFIIEANDAARFCLAQTGDAIQQGTFTAAAGAIDCSDATGRQFTVEL